MSVSPPLSPASPAKTTTGLSELAAPLATSAFAPASTGSGTSVPSSHGTYPVLNEPPGPSRRSADQRPPDLPAAAGVSTVAAFEPRARTLTARITFETAESFTELSIAPDASPCWPTGSCATGLRFIEHLLVRRRSHRSTLATMGSTREHPSASRLFGVSHQSAACLMRISNADPSQTCWLLSAKPGTAAPRPEGRIG